MVCDCCHKKKKLFESYAAIQTDGGVMNLCVDCNDLAYKLRDDANEKNREAYEKHLKALGKWEKSPNEIFVKWKKAFLKDLEKKAGWEEQHEEK